MVVSPSVAYFLTIGPFSQHVTINMSMSTNSVELCEYECEYFISKLQNSCPHPKLLNLINGLPMWVGQNKYLISEAVSWKCFILTIDVWTGLRDSWKRWSSILVEWEWSPTILPFVLPLGFWYLAQSEFRYNICHKSITLWQVKPFALRHGQRIGQNLGGDFLPLFQPLGMIRTLIMLHCCDAKQLWIHDIHHTKWYHGIMLTKLMAWGLANRKSCVLLGGVMIWYRTCYLPKIDNAIAYGSTNN